MTNARGLRCSGTTNGTSHHTGGRGTWIMTNLEFPRDAAAQSEPDSPSLIIGRHRCGDLDALPRIGRLLDPSTVILDTWTSASGDRVVTCRAIAAVRDDLAAHSMDAARVEPCVDVRLGDQAGAPVQDCRKAWKEGDSGDGHCFHCALGS